MAEARRRGSAVCRKELDLRWAVAGGGGKKAGGVAVSGRGGGRAVWRWELPPGLWTRGGRGRRKKRRGRGKEDGALHSSMRLRLPVARP